MTELEWLKKEEKFAENTLAMRKNQVEIFETRLKIIKKLIKRVEEQPNNTKGCSEG